MLFTLSFSDKSFHTIPFKMSFSMTWSSWHHIILFFKNGKETNRGTKRLCCLLFGYFVFNHSKNNVVLKLSALQTMCRVTISSVPQSISNFSSKLLKKAFYLFANLNINKKKKRLQSEKPQICTILEMISTKKGLQGFSSSFPQIYY